MGNLAHVIQRDERLGVVVAQCLKRSQLTLERASGAVLLSADVSGSVVKARLSAEDTARLALLPSSEVFLSFSYSSLRWL